MWMDSETEEFLLNRRRIKTHVKRFVFWSCIYAKQNCKAMISLIDPEMES